MPIVFRSVKGSNLTPDEVDGNFQTLVDADTTLQTNIDAKQDSLGYTPVPDTRTINGHDLTSDVTLAKSDIGLSNVDNTSDANKPVSTAQATAIALKEALANKDTDGTLAANSDTKYPSQKAVKTYADAINTTLTTLASSVNSAYVALVDAATIDIPFASKRNPAFTWTSSRTAVTFTISNDLFSAEAYIQFLKTTASNLVLTFPTGTLITDQNGSIVVGTAVTLTSTTSGDFDILIKKRSTGYRAVIKQVVA